MAKKTKQEGATALAERSEQALAVAGSVDDMFGGSGYQIPIDAPLPQLTILRETPMFETPEGEAVKEIVGHIIYWHNANQYYATAFGDGEQGPPTCCSSDGIKPDGGEEMQAETCRACPKNQFGSGEEGRGKACANTIRLYVLPDGDVIPSIIKASPASLGKKESLLRWLTNAPNVAAKAGVGTKYQPIKARFKLHKKDFDSGFSASVLDLETVRVLDPGNDDDRTKLQGLGKLYNDFMASYMGRISEDVASEAPQSTNDVGAEDGPADDCPI